MEIFRPREIIMAMERPMWRSFVPQTDVWYIANSDSLGTFTYISWGLSGDKPVTGDYDGDGKSDAAVYRPSEGSWYALRSSDGGFMGTSFGLANDLPAQGDFDGDGKTDIVVYRPSAGVWYILRSSDGSVDYASWGIAEDLPVAADYEGDGRTDVSVFRPSTGVWYVLRVRAALTSTSGAYQRTFRYRRVICRNRVFSYVGPSISQPRDFQILPVS